MKEWLIPVLRHLISGLVAFLSAWLLARAGVPITEDSQARITEALTVLGAGVLAGIWVSVAKWLKPRFFRKAHPGRTLPLDA